jgi:hypothetical protein
MTLSMRAVEQNGRGWPTGGGNIAWVLLMEYFFTFFNKIDMVENGCGRSTGGSRGYKALGPSYREVFFDGVVFCLFTH